MQQIFYAIHDINDEFPTNLDLSLLKWLIIWDLAEELAKNPI